MTEILLQHTRNYPWGKFGSSERYHPLEHHCADVAACFEALLRDQVLRSRFDRAVGGAGLCPVTEARLALLAFLHDFGKINAGFQFQVHDARDFPGKKPCRAGHIGEALLAFEREEVCEALGLYDLCERWGEDGVATLLQASLSHHGRPPKKSNRSGSGPPEDWMPFAGYDPLTAARSLAARGRAWFPQAFQDGPRLPASPELSHLFAGVVTLADQIGSSEESFPFESKLDPTYIDRARKRAREATRARGFLRAGWPRRASATDFRTLFGHERPRPLQEAVHAASLDHPLLILESETGSGKTEAAVMRFVALWQTGRVDGLYFAVPTRAAAKQLHGRVHRAMTRLFPSDANVETVLAIPGYYEAGEGRGRPAGRWEVFWEDQPDEGKRLARWAAESTRHYLSAVAAVGTVDQALLAGLKVKWAHLRGASLARSLLVVDEAHASDAYMIELLRSVLRGHLKLGGHALLMSATLGAVARTSLSSPGRARLEPPSLADAQATPYPALTVAGGGTDEIRKVADSGCVKSVCIRCEAILHDPAAIAARALAAARKGARVLLIRNTVTQAQRVFSALLDQGGGAIALQVAGGPALHHSRFAVEDRKRLDDAVERALGKLRRERGGRVVVGTQTLEQSLDIDADLLVSDLCPVDVLLQRIGRLHRHEGTERPEDFATPRCLVLTPEEALESGLDGSLLRYGFGVSDRGGIYRDLLGLEATLRLIDHHATWTIPEMNRLLVERATHPDALRGLAEQLGGAWLVHEQRTWALGTTERALARGHAFDRSQPFDDELVFPDLDETVRTRLGEDGPRIILAVPKTGPFGEAVRTFNLPAHLFFVREFDLPEKDEIEAAHAVPSSDGTLSLHVGHHTLIYDRLGVRSGVGG